MLSTNNNNYDLTGREKIVLELYDQGKSTRDIAKELRMSLRDISMVLRSTKMLRLWTDRSILYIRRSAFEY